MARSVGKLCSSEKEISRTRIEISERVDHRRWGPTYVGETSDDGIVMRAADSVDGSVEGGVAGAYSESARESETRTGGPSFRGALH